MDSRRVNAQGAGGSVSAIDGPVGRDSALSGEAVPARDDRLECATGSMTHQAMAVHIEDSRTAPTTSVG